MLEALGVLPNDEQIYRALLRHPGSTADELAEAVELAVAAVWRSVRRLEDLGLVTRVAGTQRRLHPVRPDVAVDALVAQRTHELTQAQAGARNLLLEMSTEHAHDPDDLVEIVQGRQAVARRFTQMEQTVREELLVLDRPPYAQQADLPNEGEYELLARGVRCRGIYSPEALDLPGRVAELSRVMAAGEQARTSPVVPLKMAIADRSVAILPLSSEQLTDQALVVHASTLVDALVALFEMLWGLAVPMRPLPDATPDAPQGAASVQVPAGALAGVPRELLALLAAGLGDQAIARQLGVSRRTLSRHVAALTDALDARTRFQAGVLAAGRGLIDAD